MKYTRVRRAVSAVLIDSWDEDRNPEHIKVNGNVTFTPLLNDGDVVQWAGPNGPESLVLAPIQCRISDGIIMHRGGEGVYLAAGGKGCEPSLIQWKAEFSSMQAGGWSFKLKPVMFDAVPDGEVDLTMVAPVAGASEPIVRGPAGTGIDNIKVDGAELVITARSESGVFEMARIPLEDVVRAEADAAAKSAADSAADNVRSEFTTAATSAKDSATAAAESAKIATTKAGEATKQASNAKTSASAAKTAETNAANSDSAAATNATKAEDSATAAAASAETAKAKASEATTQAVNAANSADTAKTSETNALSSADSAKSSASSAATSETSAASSASGAKSSATAASSSASKASTSEQNAAASASAAASSASQAAGSATSAKQEADRAGSIADSTIWDGDKLTVNGKTSPSLRGPKGDPGEDGTMTFEDLTPAQRDTLKGDRGEPGPPGPPGEPGAAGASTWDDISDKPTEFTPEPHQHMTYEISDLPEFSTLARGGEVVQRLADGNILLPTEINNDSFAASKGYVDAEVAKKADASHKHTMSEISDLPKISSWGNPNVIPVRDDNGRFFVSDPEKAGQAANKSYVDRQLYDKADKAHGHTMSDITDMPKIANLADGNSLVQRGRDGNFFINAPKWGEHAANKEYVDTALGTAKAYTDSLIVVGDTDATDGKLHIVYE